MIVFLLTLSLQLTSLPERISYSTVKVESPLGKVAYIPRRELFDVRIQLIAEDAGNDHVIDQLSNSDLRAGVYEGGFKTWESSLDLARLLLDRGPRKDLDELCRCDQVIEVSRGADMSSILSWNLWRAIADVIHATQYSSELGPHYHP